MLTTFRGDFVSKPMTLPEIDHVIYVAAHAYTFFASEKETGNAQPGACVDVFPRCFFDRIGQLTLRRLCYHPIRQRLEKVDDQSYA